MMSVPVVSLQKRSHTVFNSKKYTTGMERMVLDKFRTIRVLPKLSIFGLLGLANGFCYGLSLLMGSKDYKDMFAYSGDGRASNLARAMVGSDRLSNVAWTAPSLFLLGHYMHRKAGAMKMLKFSTLAIFGCAASMSAFAPNRDYYGIPNLRLISRYVPGTGSWDNISADGKYFMGADQLAQSIFYFTMLYHRMWTATLLFAAFDLACYGPMTLGGPGSAIIGALTLL